MNTPTTEPQAPSEQASPSFEERVAAASSSEPAADSAGTDPLSPSEAPAASAAATDDAAKRSEERRARIQALRDQERAKVDAKARLAEQDQIRRKYEQAQREADEAKRLLANRVDVEQLTEAQFFELAERAKVPPQKLGEFLRERMANPELAARDAASKVIDPKVSALEQALAETRAEIARLAQERQQERVEAEERAAEHELVSAVTPDTAPMTHKLLAKFGHNEFFVFARNVARSLPEGAGLQAVLDEMENRLEHVAGAFTTTPQLAAQQRQARPHTVNAAAQAKTVSNSLAQERASVVQEEDWADLTYEERVARVKRSA